jgi:hypothetical protein
LPDEINSLTQDLAGNIFGSVWGNFGGDTLPGTVFKLTTAGVYSTFHNFCLQIDCPDGMHPGNLTLDSKSNIFGTTSVGVFKLTPSGRKHDLQRYCRSRACDGQIRGPLRHHPKRGLG